MVNITDKKLTVTEPVEPILQETEETVIQSAAPVQEVQNSSADEEADEEAGEESPVEVAMAKSVKASKSKKKTVPKNPIVKNGITVELMDEGSNLPNYNIKSKRFKRNEKKQVVTLSAEDKHKKQFSDTTRATADLLQSYKSGTTLTATITGIEQAVNKRTGEIIYLLVCKYGPYKVVIQSHEFLKLDLKDENGERDLRQERLVLSRRIGSEIDFVCRFIDKDALNAMGDRLTAMQIKRRTYWFAKNEGSGNGREYHFTQGMVMEARVVSAGRTSIFVETLGVECQIPFTELSYSRIANAQDYFRPGDKVKIRLLEVKRDSKNTDVEIRASVKAATEDPRFKLFDQYKKGGIYIGEVTMLDTKNGSGVYVNLDGIDVLCFWPRNFTVSIGDQVFVQINIKDEERTRLFGSISHVIRHAAQRA